MEGVFTWLGNLVNSVVSIVLILLPKSPFVYLAVIPEVNQFLGWFNYFIPVSSMLSVAAPWLSAVGIYYGLSAALRWLKTIE